MIHTPAPRPSRPSHLIPASLLLQLVFFAMTASSLKDDKSARTWGSPQIRTAPVSPISTWGTLPTTTTSNPSLQAVIDHKTSWGSPTDSSVGSPQAWTSNSSPLYPSPSSMMGNSPSVGTYGGIYFSYYLRFRKSTDRSRRSLNPFRIFISITHLSVFIGKSGQ